LQSRLSGWIRAPEGVARALDEQDGGAPGASTGIARRRLEALIRGDGALDATGRLEIYANAYFHRIHGVLCDDYPALEGALGADLFRDLVTSYLLVHPSRHPSLRYVGDRLPGFLATEDAAAGVRERAPWAADLAALEWLRCEVFDSADGPLLTRDAVAARAPEAFADLSLRLGSWVRLAHFAHPVDRIWRQGCDGKAPAATYEVEPVCMLVFRREERVLHRPLEDLEADALELVRSTIDFAGLCEWVASRVGASEAPQRAAGWLERWLDEALLAAPDESGSDMSASLADAREASRDPAGSGPRSG
jgi:hypothetical protein